MTPKIYISLLIVVEESVSNELLDLLREMGATECWRKGQTKRKTTITYKNSGCAFRIEPITGLSVESAISYFWDHISLEEIGLHQVIQQYSLTPILSVAVYVKDTIPSVHFESSDLKKLSQFNIGIDIDIILM